VCIYKHTDIRIYIHIYLHGARCHPIDGRGLLLESHRLALRAEVDRRLFVVLKS
jgi:hypothetical protein